MTEKGIAHIHETAVLQKKATGGNSKGTSPQSKRANNNEYE